MNNGKLNDGKRKGIAWLKAAIGASAIAWSVAGCAQSAAVPVEWVSYARLVGAQFQSSLEVDGVAADQLHAYLEDRILHAKNDAPPAAIVVRAWVGADGAVTRIAFDSLGDAQADANLRTLLTAHPIGVPPPSEMRQPLRVRLRLEENPGAAPGQGASAAS